MAPSKPKKSGASAKSVRSQDCDELKRTSGAVDKALDVLALKIKEHKAAATALFFTP